MRPALEQGSRKQNAERWEINFSERICYMFWISKCGGDLDLGLCTTSGLAFGELQRSGDFGTTYVFRRRKNPSWILIQKNFWSKTRHAKTPFFAHTQTSNNQQFTPQHYAPPSRPTTPYWLHPTPTSRTLHPTHTPSMKIFFSCLPQIFHSEFVRTPVRESTLRECEFPNLVIYQPRLSLGLPYAPSLSGCLFLWVCVVCGACGSEAQRAEATTRHQGRSTPRGEFFWIKYRGFIWEGLRFSVLNTKPSEITPKNVKMKLDKPLVSWKKLDKLQVSWRKLENPPVWKKKLNKTSGMEKFRSILCIDEKN